ncbi:hypothetical protein A5761_04595 [Mycolicibacterium setense]|nr:hypothetical protein A5761_04595 [Mycolicibacterium setense]
MELAGLDSPADLGALLADHLPAVRAQRIQITIDLARRRGVADGEGIPGWRRSRRVRASGTGTHTRTAAGTPSTIAMAIEVLLDRFTDRGRVRAWLMDFIMSERISPTARARSR